MRDGLYGSGDESPGNTTEDGWGLGGWFMNQGRVERRDVVITLGDTDRESGVPKVRSCRTTATRDRMGGDDLRNRMG